MKNLKTPLGIIGLLYILFGTVVNSYMFIAQSYPSYIFFIIMAIGLFLLLINGITKKLPNYKFWQLLIGIAPILIGYLLIQAKKPTDDIILIPENYKGVIAVIYDMESGEKEELENGKRVYRIPENGILKIQSKLKNNSWSLGEYYYLTKDNHRTKIKRLINYRVSKFPDTINTYAYDGHLKEILGENIIYQQAVIGTKKDTFDIDISERIKRIASLK